jgi:A/G-specific adenine glycosylase
LLQDLLKNFNIQAFQTDLLAWYDKHKRNLPWRESSDPYRIWVSEIMLQQTKVDTVIPYFTRFMEKYPSLETLAEAEEEEVLKDWEGLGYYSRARNLHSAVREVVETYGGEIPNTKEDLSKLKGVGPYTQGAILSIAFNEPEPAVDGNVMRVFSRLFLINDDIGRAKTKRLFEDVVKEVISEEDPSSFNQAIMDLGATICTPKSPACLICPVQEHCKAFEVGAEEELPVKTKAKKQKTIPYAALILKFKEGKYLIEKRPEEGLLANMYQFPMVPLLEVELNEIPQWFHEKYGINIKLHNKEGELKHVFSHLIWEMDLYQGEVLDDEVPDAFHVMNVEEMQNVPFPVSHLRIRRLIE